MTKRPRTLGFAVGTTHVVEIDRRDNLCVPGATPWVTSTGRSRSAS
jgi:hypothetical protein